MRIIADQWQDYCCIDAGGKEKLERWKTYLLRRPDPQAVWKKNEDASLWNKVHGHYHRSNQGGGSWEFKKELPEFWTVQYRTLTFKVSPTGFKHTGLFPEQAVNWDWMSQQIQRSQRNDLRILNLFAYTGAATMACSQANAAEVVHVDASKGMVSWAKENMELCHLNDHKIRFIVDDCLKFLQREKRRGRTYHGIVMDPPSYGRGPNNEIWKMEDQLNELIRLALDVLDQDAVFFLINCYTTGFSSIVLENILKMTIGKKYSWGQIEAGEVGLPTTSGLILPCGIFGRWSRD